uniref:Rhodopsin domain-containing protein n=1 Tax=Fusarium oxysporum (strain Fo5176) TaxID=660025 RepID=A0A0D2YHQ2_FUSOF
MESKQTDLWVVLFVTFTAATIVTILRLLSRRLKRNSLSWDDYFALCGYIFMGIFHCVPVQAFWDSTAGGYCAIEDKKFFFGTTLVHNIIDIAILVLPMMEIGKLQLPILQKAGIMIMFTFGFFICAAGIRLIVAARVFDDTSPDLTWNIVTIVVWATVEVNLINVSASLPVIRPACTFIFTCTNPRTVTGASSNSYGNSYSRSQRKQSIRLDTISMSAPNDESSSTHQLAVSDDGSGRGLVSEFESHAADQYHPSGIKYTSTLMGQSGAGAGGFESDLSQISITNEIIVDGSKQPRPGSLETV